MPSWSFITATLFSILIGLFFVLLPEKYVSFLKGLKKEFGFWKENSTDELWLSDNATKVLTRIFGILIILFVSFVFYIAVKYAYP